VKLEERIRPIILNDIRPNPIRENHTAEETANGKVGTPNPYGRYLSGTKTLNEAQFQKRTPATTVTRRREQRYRRL